MKHRTTSKGISVFTVDQHTLETKCTSTVVVYLEDQFLQNNRQTTHFYLDLLRILRTFRFEKLNL